MAFIEEATGAVSEISKLVSGIASWVGGLFSDNRTAEDMWKDHGAEYMSKGGTREQYLLWQGQNHPKDTDFSWTRGFQPVPYAPVPGFTLDSWPQLGEYFKATKDGSMGKWNSTEFGLGGTPILVPGGGIAGGSLDTTQGGDAADVINDWLGRATSDLRTVKTDNSQLLLVGVVVLIAVWLFKR